MMMMIDGDDDDDGDDVIIHQISAALEFPADLLSIVGLEVGAKLHSMTGIHFRGNSCEF